MEKRFHFTHPFLESFNETISLLSEQLNKLNTLEKGFTNEMGVYNCSYKMRYITPSDIAEYISNIHKGMMNNLISSNPSDLELFAAESVRRIMDKHECEPFNAPGLMGNNFIDTKNTTLQDLLVIHANAVYNRIVRTPFEQKENFEELKKGDLKIFNDIHYVANMKKIVDGMPDMIESMEGGEIYKATPVIGKAFRMVIEEFIMFATTLNLITVNSMVDYCIPSATFATKSTHPAEEDTPAEEASGFNEYVTECCLLKTNMMTIENRLPFNCNLRNVVLQDTTPLFTDTRDAVKFILNDSRSPINGLLVKYTTLRRGEYGAEMIKQAFLTHRHGYGDRKLQSDVNRRMEERCSFHTDEGWFDKIVYGTQELDSNYRIDNPGNQHEHNIMYDLRTIYKMFSCHHNDNEHLANNIVKVANIICSLIESHSYNQYEVFRDNLRDVLAVLAEILTKDILALYHNNNNVLICRDDMNDTMIPGYMYCEAFVMEDGETTTNNATQGGNQQSTQTTVQNKTEGVKQTGTLQKVGDKILQLIRKFAEYIRNTISQIFPKFNANHAAEIKWVDAHKDLNTEIQEALPGGSHKNKKGEDLIQFKVSVQNYPAFNLPARAIEDLKQKVDSIGTNLNSYEAANAYINGKDGKGGIGIDGFKKELIFPKVAEKNPQSVKDLQQFTNDYLLYGDKGKPAQQGATDVTSEQWKSLCENLGKNAVDAMKMFSTDITAIMTTLADKTKKIAEEEKRLIDNQNNDKNPNGEKKNITPIAQQLFNVITEVTQGVYTQSFATLTKEFYGRSYNCYRDIVAEYQRTQKNGVDQQTNQAADQTAQNVTPNANAVANPTAAPATAAAPATPAAATPGTV